MSERGHGIARRTMFWVEPGKAWNLAWIVVKRDVGVVAEFDHRKAAQDFVRGRNHA